MARPGSRIAATRPLYTMECEDFVGTGLRFVSGASGALVATSAAYPGAAEKPVLGGTLGTATLVAHTPRVD